MVRLYRTFSKLHRYRGNKVCRVLVDAFGVVQVHRTFSNHSSAELTRCVEVFHRRSAWFDSSLPTTSQKQKGVWNLRYRQLHRKNTCERTLYLARQYRAFSTYFFTAETRFAGCLCTRSGGGSRTANLLEPSRTTSSQR